jgi:hypothetical protein
MTYENGVKFEQPKRLVKKVYIPPFKVRSYGVDEYNLCLIHYTMKVLIMP